MKICEACGKKTKVVYLFKGLKLCAKCYFKIK